MIIISFISYITFTQIVVSLFYCSITYCDIIYVAVNIYFNIKIFSLKIDFYFNNDNKYV